MARVRYRSRIERNPYRHTPTTTRDVDPQSPWSVNLCGTICETITVTERIGEIRLSKDAAWLDRVIAWRGSEETVREAARQRLRGLAKEAK
jgi:hypothetical protein